VDFPERQLVTVVVDLANFTHSVRGMDAPAIASLIDRFYRTVHAEVAEHGGRVVKLLGDGCLIVFPADRALDAVDFVDELRGQVEGMTTPSGNRLGLGVNLHLSTVAEGEFGPDRRYDIVGAGVIHTFRMGGGEGIRISEPVYRKLPSDRRSGWTKRQPPATYTQVAS
jgi:class 3 adenylate cyclase